MSNNVRGNTSWSNLCHARFSEPFDLFCTTHKGRKISQYYYAVHKIIRSFRKYTCKHVKATRKRRNLRPFLKRDYVSITLRSWNAALIPNIYANIYAMHGKWRLYVSLSRVVYFLFVPAFKFPRPVSKL